MKLNKNQRDILTASVRTLTENAVNKPITVAYNIDEVRSNNYAKTYKKYCEDMQKLEDVDLIARDGLTCFAYMNVSKIEEIKNLL